MAEAYSPTGMEHVKTGLKQAMKRKLVYDASDRLSIVYEAKAGAVHGEKCFKTQYWYEGTTDLIIFCKETEGAWDSSWEPA